MRMSKRWLAVCAATTLASSLMVVGHAGPQPVVKMCVDGRQTEDPTSPPCIAYFEGDNGGQTWQGVTADEITVLIYRSAVWTVGDDGLDETPRAGTYCDVDLMDCDGDGVTDEVVSRDLRAANTYSRYFNQRFQTYDRHVHAYVYYASGTQSPASRRADAADNWERLAPFAVIDQARFGRHNEVYADAMARRSVTVFGNYSNTRRSYLALRSPNVWSYWPDLDSWSETFASYVCNKVAGTKVTAGGYSGEDRRYALYGAGSEGIERVASIKANLALCGVSISDEATFFIDSSGAAIDAGGSVGTAPANVAAMRLAGYNTVIWAGGVDTETTRWADLLGYSPEWIVAGDGRMESNGHGRLQGQGAWANAWAISYLPRFGPRSAEPAAWAYRHSDPEGEYTEDIAEMYPDWFLMFTAIQTAGPGLTPSAIEDAFRARPKPASSYPYAPNGYFPPGDFSFVDDAYESWWDPTALETGGGGCYRLVGGGRRSTVSSWSLVTDMGLGKRNAEGTPDGNERVVSRDPCTTYEGTVHLGAGLPTLT